MVTSAIKLRHLLLGIKAMTYLDSILKSRNITLLTNLSSQSYGYSSSHVRMWELDHKECWMPKNWCFQTVVLEKTLESPLDLRKIQPVNPKGSQSWIFTGRTAAEAEAPILWLPDVKSWLIGKDPDAGRDWGQEKGMTEDAMTGWHHQLPEFTQTHVHRVGDTIQSSHPLSFPSLTFGLSQHQGLFQWVSSLCKVAKVLQF